MTFAADAADTRKGEKYAVEESVIPRVSCCLVLVGRGATARDQGMRGRQGTIDDLA